MTWAYTFADVYGSSSYNSSSYNSSGTTTSGGTNGGGSTTTGSNTSSGTTSSGTTTTPTSTAVLTNTGFDIAAIVGLAATILLLALVVRIWKRPAKTSA